MLAITGNGTFYSSGIDFQDALSALADTSPENLAQQSNDQHIALIDALIDFPKPIAAMVNGPAIGMGKLYIKSYQKVYQNIY